MKILFISSGNNSFGISPIVKNQGESLIKLGHEVLFFTIKGKGILGYMVNIPKIRRFFKKNKPDVVHAHYSLCGFVASIAGCRPLVVSLMGSDVKSSASYKESIMFFSKHLWKRTIVKSDDMKDSLGMQNLCVVPNGVDTEVYTPKDKLNCQAKLGWGHKYV